MYTLYTGQLLFIGKNDDETVEMIIGKDIEKALKTDIDDEMIREVLQDMLQRDPVNRKTANALLAHAWFSQEDT